MLAFIQEHALKLVLAAIPVGIIASLLFQVFKRLRKWVDELPTYLKQGAIFLIGSGLAVLGQLLNVPIVCEPEVNCLTQLDEATIKALLTGALSLGSAKFTHYVIKRKK